MQTNLTRSELQTFELEVLRASGQPDVTLGNLIQGGSIPLDASRAIVYLRPVVKVWYKSRAPNPEEYVTILQMRILKGRDVIFCAWAAEPFCYESVVVSAQKLNFAPFTVGNRAVGEWSADAAVKFLDPVARGSIRPGMFQQALARFQYTLVASLNFEIRDTRIRVSASGELMTGVDVDALRRRTVNVDDI